MIGQSSLVIVDVEATCSKDGSIPWLEMEVIEIGAILVDSDKGRVKKEFVSFVKPMKHPMLTMFCSELTGIQQSDVEGASLFPTVFGSFCEWMNGLSLSSFSSWGRFDPLILRRNCGFHGVQYPFASHVDLGRLFAKRYGRRRNHRGAMKIAGLVPEGLHHRGLHDARNMAKMIPLLLSKETEPC